MSNRFRFINREGKKVQLPDDVSVIETENLFTFHLGEDDENCCIRNMHIFSSEVIADIQEMYLTGEIINTFYVNDFTFQAISDFVTICTPIKEK